MFKKCFFLLTFYSCLFTSLAQQKSFSVEPFFNRTLTPKERDSLDSRIQEYSQYLQKDSTLAMIYFYRGNTYAALGLLHKAYSDYSTVILLDTNAVEAYFNRALCRMNYNVTYDACKDLNVASRKGLLQARLLFDKTCGIYKDTILKK